MNTEPTYDLPRTDAEAELALRYLGSAVAGAALPSIFRCRRALGDDLLTAYVTALTAYIQAGEQAHVMDDNRFPDGTEAGEFERAAHPWRSYPPIEVSAVTDDGAEEE
jgi:hypothetical protein